MTPETLQQISSLSNLLRTLGRTLARETEEVRATNDHVEIIKHFNHIRIAAEEVKEAREDLAKITDFLSKDVIPDVVRELRERTGEKPPFSIEGVGRVSIATRISCSILDKPKGYQWLRDTGNGSLIQETVNSSTLSAFAKSYVEDEGKDLPEDIFKMSSMSYTSITKK